MKKAKLRLLSFLLAIVLLAAGLPFTASAAEANPFTDVPAEAWYSKAVQYVYEHGLFNGTSAATFSPDAPMTRAMFVQVLANKTENYKKSDWEGKSSFSDVNAAAWYAAPLAWATAHNIMNGSDGKLNPGSNARRSEVAQLFMNADAVLKSVILDTEPDADEMTGPVFFGAYPQTSGTAEPIEWLVLDSRDGRVLLLAKDCIDSRPWNSRREAVTWDNSNLRAWLNGDFLQTAFTAEEQERILLSDLDNGDGLSYGTSVGADTQDKVFLLSGAEVTEYLPSDALRTAKPTAYAISHGAYTNGSGDCAWWLRSPGMTATSPAYIASGGNIGNRAHEVNETIIGVRPAVWVKNENSRITAKPVSNASDIWDRYNRDPKKYEATYDGELVTATGVVNYIGRDSHGTPSMEIADVEGGTSYVLGVFGSFDEMAAVSVGDTVSISGYFHIMSSENMVVLKRCEIHEIYK